MAADRPARTGTAITRQIHASCSGSTRVRRASINSWLGDQQVGRSLTPTCSSPKAASEFKSGVTLIWETGTPSASCRERSATS
eukprot:6781537-Prymnesium_polylepis.1